jgi:hypothetical protein
MPPARGLDAYHRERTAAVEAFNRSRLGLGDPDAKAATLKGRLARISGRYGRGPWSKRLFPHRYGWLARLLGLVLLVGSIPATVVTIAAYYSGWSVHDTARHFLAAPNCDAARAVGLASAYRGEPGYWPQHDRDKDGIACEPWPPSRFGSPSLTTQ